jgi:hypothetical protein
METNETTVREIAKGDTIICKNTNVLKGNRIAPALENEKEYKAKDVIICTCGTKHIDVGIASLYNYVSCYECKSHLPKGDVVHYCHPSRFEIKVEVEPAAETK